MRVLVRRVKDGVREVVVIPGRSQGMPPVVLRGTTKEEVLEGLRQVVERVRGGKQGRLPDAPSG